jgi:ribosomal protein L32E
LTEIFIATANSYENANLAMTRVCATKGDLSAVFGVDIKRTAYFFKDRMTTLNASGRRVPIFHIVRAHKRRTKTSSTVVKFHFRGERKFVWNGYQVSITVPGLHHTPLAEFDVGSVDIDKLNPRERALSSTQIGRAWKEHVRGKSLSEVFNS